MLTKIKYIIAREGLIFLSILALTILQLYCSERGTIFFSYPIYLLIRFIAWAVKTIKKYSADQKANNLN